MASGEGAGKGDKRRPLGVPEEVFFKNYENAFGKKEMWWESEEHQKWVKEAQTIKKQFKE